MSQKTKAILGRLLIVGPAVAVMSLGLLATGCDDDAGNPFVLSIHPLYIEVDLDFDPTLVGKWVDEEGDVTFIFEKSGNQEYKLTVVEREDKEQSKGEFDAHLVRLGGSWFLDIYPKSLQGGSEFYWTHFIRAHTIARLWIEGDSVKMAFLSSNWLKKRFEDKSVDAAHEIIEGAPILTDTTEDVQNLVDRFANDEEAFPDPLVLQRTEQEGEEK